MWSKVRIIEGFHHIAPFVPLRSARGDAVVAEVAEAQTGLLSYEGCSSPREGILQCSPMPRAILQMQPSGAVMSVIWWS